MARSNGEEIFNLSQFASKPVQFLCLGRPQAPDRPNKRARVASNLVFVYKEYDEVRGLPFMTSSAMRGEGGKPKSRHSTRA